MKFTMMERTIEFPDASSQKHSSRSTPAAGAFTAEPAKRSIYIAHTLSAARFIGLLVWSAVCSTALKAITTSSPGCIGCSRPSPGKTKPKALTGMESRSSVLVLPNQNLLYTADFPELNDVWNPTPTPSRYCTSSELLQSVNYWS